MWWWRKIRPANIPAELRERFEFYGETVLALSVTSGDMNQSTQGVELAGLVRQKRAEIIAWLKERRDISQRHEDRIETVEWAILIFVILGVVLDIALLAQGFGWLRSN